ncbi:hypothetical protein K1719_039072 [Acacia pycnantha]|nr:hypothetical protein K1719_039072 [Acacia pycnantha]
MAEQVPYGVVVSIINRLASSAFKEIALIYGVNSEIERLKDTVEAIKAVVVDAEQKQRNYQLIKIWIRRLKKVLLKADDLLDDLQTQHLLRKRDGKRKVRDYFTSSNPIVFGLKVARKIRKIREQFNSVAEDASELNLDTRVLVIRHNESNWRETSSKPEENIIGREESKKEIIDLLLNTNNGNQSVSVVAIVGMGGLGKTTLAQLVYNNAQVNKFFNKQMWVCASEEFHVKALVKKILESSMGSDVNDQQL